MISLSFVMIITLSEEIVKLLILCDLYRKTRKTAWIDEISRQLVIYKKFNA